MFKTTKTTSKSFTLLALGGLTALLSVGFSACANSSGTQAETGQSAAQETAQHSMPGMDHGGMQMQQSPGSSMSGMDHGSMDLGPKDEAFDLRFVDAMIPHHEGAVVMAKEALQKSKRPEIQQLAQAIIEAQDKEIAQMKEWRKTWYPTMAATPMMYHAEMGHMMPMTEEMRNSMMMTGDLGAADDQFDLRFLNAMIPHHQGAVDMANQAMEKSDRSEIQQLSQAIISSQQQEITQMEQWRKQWYGQ